MGTTTTPQAAADQMQQAAAQVPQSAANQGWMQAAQSAAPMPTENQTSSATIPQQQTPPPTQQPVVITPQKRGGILGVMDSVASALTGNTKPEIATDQDGNKYVKETTLTHGEQWRRIAGEAIEGAAAGLAAGKGAGNMGQAAEAGVQVAQRNQQQQQQQEQQMTAQARQQNLDRANFQMLQMQMAKSSWELANAKHVAAQKDVEFANQQIDRYLNEGGKILGTAAHPGDIAGILHEDPEVMKNLIQKGTIRILPNYDDKGNLAGITAIKMPDQWGTEMLPAGAVFHTYDPVSKQIVEHKSADPMTAGEQANYDAIAMQQQMKAQSDQAALDQKNADAAAQRANASKAPSEIARNKAEANEANANAGKNNAATAQIRAGMMNPDGTTNPQFEALAQALYDGDIMPNDLKREAKGAGMDPNQLIARAVQIGQQNGKPWSESIIKQEFEFAHNQKTQAFMSGVDRILGGPGASGYLDQMNNLAQQAHLSTNGLFNSAQLAVRRGLGENKAKQLNTLISETQRSIAGLIGNPLLGGSESDKKLEQAQEMLGGSPTVENLKGATDILTTALNTARASVMQHNRFLARRYGNAGTAAQPQNSQTQPPPIPAGTPPPPQDMKRVWAPGMTTWRDIPANQVKNIPGQVVQ